VFLTYATPSIEQRGTALTNPYNAGLRAYMEYIGSARGSSYSFAMRGQNVKSSPSYTRQLFYLPGLGSIF